MTHSPLAILAMPKPFHGHIGMIQRNAIQSWTHLSPRPEIFLCGDRSRNRRNHCRIESRTPPKRRPTTG